MSDPLHYAHPAFANLHRRRAKLRRLAIAQMIITTAATLLAAVILGVLIGMAVTTAEAMPKLIADAHERAKG